MHRISRLARFSLWSRAIASLALLSQAPIFAAQGVGAAESLDRQVENAFRQVLKAPASQEAGLKYARLLIESGNYEGGVAALERLLLVPDPSPSVRLELAVLYYRMGSYGMSETLLRQALDDGRLEDAQRALAQSMLSDTSARNQPSQLTGLIMLGVRHQTNPSMRSNEAWVYSAGTQVPLLNQFKPQSDTDTQLPARIDHRYDLGLQNEAAVVSSLVAQVTKFQSSSGSQLQPNQVAPYNLAWGELTTGIRFKPAPVALPGLRLRPYRIVAELGAQGHRYLSSKGVGLDARFQIDEKTAAGVVYEHRNYRYAERIDVPNASLLGGPDNSVRMLLSREVAPGQVVSAELGLRSHGAGASYYDYDSPELRMSYQASFASPFSERSSYWTGTLWTSALQRKYGGADPGVTADRRRKDNEWRIGANLSVPVSERWSLLLQVEHVRIDSNLPNYQARNTAVQGALAYRF